MDDLGMKSFKALSEEKERLSRELADACRDYIDLKCSHNEILLRYHIVKKTLTDLMLRFNEAASSSEAEQKISDIMTAGLEKSSQLHFPFSETKESQSDG
jgi:hypothetical protein